MGSLSKEPETMLTPCTDITPHLSPAQGLCYTTGLMPYDEALLDGHLLGRFGSPCGQAIWAVRAAPRNESVSRRMDKRP